MLKVPEEGTASWCISVNGEQRLVESKPNDGKTPQPWKLTFAIENPGRQTISIRKAGSKNTAETEISEIQLSGTAIQDASLLRARWRPKAIHTQYHSSTCPETKLWVFESQSIEMATSYSPMTTNFGYFGGSFTDNQTAKGNLNFSMWAVGKDADEMPPIDSMPHLLATGNPKASFSGFGHEGSGVKIRDWDPIAIHSKSLIQALRVEPGNDVNTYFGYFFDEQKSQWVLYAVGRKSAKARKRRRQKENSPVSLRPASFCEVPGPPQSQRTGDQLRIIRRRGWFYGVDNNWHVVDRQTTKVKSDPVNQFIDSVDGWFLMGTGGMEMLRSLSDVKIAETPTEVPKYLQPEIAQQLFELPIEFSNHCVESVTRNSATIQFEFSKLGKDATATLYYGLKDCLTFRKRELHGTEKKGLSSELLSGDRTWANSTESIPVHNDRVLIELRDLTPNSTYYYRLLVTSADGKSWDFETRQFSTR